MGSSDYGRCVFPLKSLQIGDLQSYLSHLDLFLAPESKIFYILVDNRPWLKDLVSGPAHLWQLMVTKSRLPPFANTRAHRVRMDAEGFFASKTTSESDRTKPKKSKQWFSLIDVSTLSRKRAILPVKKLTSLDLNSKLHRTLYGYIVFEVAWTDVRGINYYNELQTDTSLAIEAKFMRRWEFDSVAQASGCISLWFAGTQNEQFLLKEHLDLAIGDEFHDAQEDFPETCIGDEDENICNVDFCSEDESPFCLNSSFNLFPVNMEDEIGMPHTPHPPDGPHKRRKVMASISCGGEVDLYSEETCGEIIGSPVDSQNSYTSKCEVHSEATQYRDVLILFRFNDRDLPFKLREIIMGDLRLLTLLESGLPSWVIFLQSYPGFCHIYRPWMRPLASALYVVISVITVLIGFYDLYKNVPVIKETASRLCGPLFDWIETWEIVSRIKYLGTMLFLHNFQKAVQWFLMITRTTRSFFSILIQPMAGPLVDFFELFVPFWNICIQLGGSFCSNICTIIGSSLSLVGDLVEIVLYPIWFILSVIWTVAIFVIYPAFWIIWKILYVPIQLVLGLSNLMTSLYNYIYYLVGDIWLFLSSIFQFASSAEKTAHAYEVSVWRSLWNDLFSQIFCALRSILNGIVAFFTACNRHCLSWSTVRKAWTKSSLRNKDDLSWMQEHFSARNSFYKHNTKLTKIRYFGKAYFAEFTLINPTGKPF